ncbi:hypothetical protein D9611_007434 [Ephemerocybe angulata]|uniref:Uncharacterized protein n=1 Tax=Ephemerocybe angulata TaxID=980116 RepID=A0A8H5CH72_9AGAR|nr:hypothetical protein D9611_007434 [Tulosesus angulatus]
MKFAVFISILLLAATASWAAPIAATPDSEVQRVISPHITSPEQDDFWVKGSRQIVRWDTDKLDKESLNSNGLVVLGWSEPGSDNEHLDLENPLASNFSLAEGWIEVEVPEEVETRENYFIVLFGDSGNISPSFTIDQL